MRPATQRAARRRSREGAALVEAVVAIPFFIITFASIIFVGQTYSAKLGVMRNAREPVVAYASSNCGTQGDATSSGSLSGLNTGGLSTGAQSNGGNGGADTSSASAVGNAPNAGVLNKSMGTVSMTSQFGVTGSGIIGAATVTPASSRKMVCNEPPYDGDLGGAVSSAWHDITGW